VFDLLVARRNEAAAERDSKVLNLTYVNLTYVNLIHSGCLGLIPKLVGSDFRPCRREVSVIKLGDGRLDSEATHSKKMTLLPQQNILVNIASAN